MGTRANKYFVIIVNYVDVVDVDVDVDISVNVAVGDVSLPQTLSPDAHHGSPRGPLMVSRAACTSTAHPLVHAHTHVPSPTCALCAHTFRTLVHAHTHTYSH